MDSLEKLKQFVFNGILTEDSITHLEKEGISVRQGSKVQPIARIEETDFSPRIIHNGSRMASIYIVFYCLENSVRELIVSRLSERKGIDWWEKCVPDKIKKNVNNLINEEEKNKYHAQRSTNNIGYTMFGNLAQIVINNWEDFSDLIPNQHWLTSRFDDLEKSRNIIMHTGILPEIEIERIESITRDWLRQVG